MAGEASFIGTERLQGKREKQNASTQTIFRKENDFNLLRAIIMYNHHN